MLRYVLRSATGSVRWSPQVPAYRWQLADEATVRGGCQMLFAVAANPEWWP